MLVDLFCQVKLVCWLGGCLVGYYMVLGRGTRWVGTVRLPASRNRALDSRAGDVYFDCFDS